MNSYAAGDPIRSASRRNTETSYLILLNSFTFIISLMNSSTTTISNNLYTHHGKFSIVEQPKVMDTGLSDQVRDQQPAKSDVVESSIDRNEVKGNLQLQSQEPNPSPNPPLESQGIQTEEWKPYRFTYEGKTPSRVFTCMFQLFC